MSVTGHSETGPAKAGVALVNIITGLHATMGIQTALLERHRTGEGQLIEVNLMSSVLSPLSNQTSAHILTGAVPGLMGNAHPSVAPYQPFEAADRPLAIAATTNAQFVKLVNALDLPQLVDDPSYSSNADRVAHVRRWSLNWNTCFGGRPPTTGSVCSVRSVFHALRSTT
jgi:crotonobetainyl-CoA:carnitine CoA-transferase CaiB-like acyl-CoA transferase